MKAEVPQADSPGRAGRLTRGRFWAGNALIGTVCLFVGGVVVLSSIFIHDDVQQAAGLSFDNLVTDVGAGIFWSGLALIGTCYVSIPVATLWSPPCA